MIAIATFFFTRKESFGERQTMFLTTPRLKPVLRSRNEETMDVLAYSLGGLDKPTPKNC
ncbi:hypothetical protein PBCVNEJV1_556L [Paramecium bursaria Chlorella virus NE-JV-1]|nr:hypothetical protein PBCVNEJV1_556L [Paramecium bursaria Chlorella virus NE-JV-1]